jgi:hypothetical protein
MIYRQLFLLLLDSNELKRKPELSACIPGICIRYVFQKDYWILKEY